MTPLSLDLVARIIRSDSRSWPDTPSKLARRVDSGSVFGAAIDPPFKRSHQMWVHFGTRHVSIQLTYRGVPRLTAHWRLTHREWVELIAQPTLFEAT